jgi:hypothetical protein
MFHGLKQQTSVSGLAIFIAILILPALQQVLVTERKDGRRKLHLHIRMACRATYLDVLATAGEAMCLVVTE